MPIYIEEKSLPKRMLALRKILLPLSSKISAQRENSVPNSFVLGVSGQGMQNSGAYRDWRFKTNKDKYYANYTEIWNPAQGSEWRLAIAYLTIYNGPLSTGKEILSLHCDPDEPAGSAHYKYKCGPHMHVHHTDNIIKSAHIALNLPNFNLVVNDIEQLNKAFVDAVEMITKEFLS
jgi:hypothetical protein